MDQSCQTLYKNVIIIKRDWIVTPRTPRPPWRHRTSLFHSYIETFLQKFCLLTFSHIPMTPRDRNNLLRRQLFVHWTVLYWSGLGRIWDCTFRVVFTPFSFPFFCTGHPSILAFLYFLNIPLFGIIYIFRCYILTYLFLYSLLKSFALFLHIVLFFPDQSRGLFRFLVANLI